ncbi:MAG TPA: tetratricopeptide repeat protein [Saccharospirillum sp.]|nr:tetratricopeptide repeat protein [Saccharospirillum sp.]
MSLMHHALDRPATPGQTNGNGYNPLQRNAGRSAMVWWVITGLALLITLALLAWPRWRPAAEPPIPALVQPQPTEVSLPTPAVTNTVAVAPVASEPESATEEPALETSPAAMDRPEPTAPPEKQFQAPAPSEPEPSASPQASPEQQVSPEQPAVAETREQPRQPDVEQAIAEAQQPVAEPTAPSPAEALPAPADTPNNATVTQADANRSTEAVAAADTQSSSSVATAVPQHDTARQAVQSAIGRGDLTQAQQLLQSWINREPRLEEPRIWLAKVYLSRGARQEAEALLVGLESTEALGLRGLVLEQTERYADAARIFEALTRKEARNPQWWLHWAINMENSGRLAEARLLYQTYLEQFSSHNARLTAFATERYRALAG